MGGRAGERTPLHTRPAASPTRAPPLRPHEALTTSRTPHPQTQPPQGAGCHCTHFRGTQFGPLQRARQRKQRGGARGGVGAGESGEGGPGRRRGSGGARDSWFWLGLAIHFETPSRSLLPVSSAGLTGEGTVVRPTPAEAWQTRDSRRAAPRAPDEALGDAAPHENPVRRASRSSPPFA